MKKFVLPFMVLMCLLTQGFSQSANPNDPNVYQYVFIDAGLNHSVALRCNGTVNTWGDNAFGQLGNDDDPNDSNVPVVVSGTTGTDSLTQVVAVAAGDNHTLALLSNGMVAAWGDNNSGQLGNGTTINSPFPVIVEDVGGGGTLSNAVAIAAGRNHSLAILDDGSAVAWGNNSSGQLADGTTTQRSYPVLMTGIDIGTEAYAIAAGNKHSYVLQSDGIVKSCGSDENGQLGDNGNSGAGSYTSLLYVNIDNSGNIPLENIIAIASGPTHGLALDSNGEIWSWGNDGSNNYALGRNATTPQYKYAGLVDNINNAIAIAAGTRVSFAMLDDGTVWTFGDDDSGQLGIGAGDESTMTPAPIPSLSNIKAIESGGPHAIVLTENDTIKSFGNNSDGQLGLGYTGGGEHTPQIVSQYNMGVVYADAGPDQFYCDGGSVQLGGEPGDYSNYFYQWQPLIGLDGGPVSTSNPDTLAQPYSEVSTQTFTTIDYVLWKIYRYSTLINGCYETDTAKITVRGSAYANFSSNAPVCFGDTVNFVNTGSSGSGLQYQWNFGSGAAFPPGSDTLENPSGITYDSHGIKLVTLTITDSVCGSSDSYSDGITIYEQPTSSFTYTPAANICKNTSVDFTNTGTSGVNWSYTWDFGSDAFPSTSNSENPQGITYTSPGNKTITLTISNGNCTENYSEVVVIDPSPVADFEYNAPALCTNSPVDFENTGTTGDSYQWDFGADATPATSTAENPTNVIYSTHGVKMIQLITTIGSCTDTIEKTLSISEKPAPAFNHTAPQCEGGLVDFTYNGTTGTDWTYLWDFGEGAIPSTSTQQNPGGVFYNGAGTKTVQLTVSNGMCSAIISQNITIEETPVADFTHISSFCTTDAVDFENTGTTGATYEWSFGIGATPPNSTNENPVGIIYDSPGIKTVELITTLGTCTDTMVKTINITETPDPDFTHTAPQCEEALVDFTYTGTTGTDWNYLWDFGEGATPSTSTQESPVGVEYDGAGNKIVQLTVTNGMCSETVTHNFNIDEKPVADFTHNSTYCTTDAVDFENTGTTGATYEWSFGSGATPANTTDENPVGIIYDSPGIKTVQLITTLGTCTDTMVKTINITETPDPDFDHSPLSQCEEALVDFNYIGTTGTDWNYLWDFGEGAIPSTSTQESPVGVEYDGAGNKTVQLTVTNGMCSETVTHNFNIDEKPVADFTHNSTYCTTDAVDFENTGTSGATYEWSFGSGATPANTTDENPVGIIYDSPGIKTVQLITTLGTCTDTMVKTINITETPDPDFTHNAPQCAGTSINFSYTGSTGNDWNYLWDFGQGANPAISTQQNPESVKYSGGDKSVLLTVTNAQCSESIEQTISIYPLPVADAGVDTTICANTSVQIGSDPVSGYGYQWWDPDNSLDDTSIANPTASPSASLTTYHLLVTDSNGCQNTDSVTVVMMNSAFVNAGSDVEICYGDTVQIGMGLIEWQSYEWTPEQGLSDPYIPNPMASPDSTTTYTVSVQYEQCETITDDVRVLVHPLPDIEATGPHGEDTVEIAQWNNTQLIATGGTQYEWSPVFSLNSSGIYNPIAFPDTSTLYTVTGTDIYGCVNDDDVYVLVRIPGLYIPSAFTPNGDDRNDVFYIRCKGTNTFELNIVSRNGNLLYHSKNPDEGWDGTIQGTGKEVPSGAYVFHTKGEFSDGEKFNESGIINLIR